MLSVFAVILSFIVILFLPGKAVLSYLIIPYQGERERNFLSDLFQIVFISFLVTSIVGIILALLGAFSFAILFLFNILFYCFVFLTWKGKKKKVSLTSYKFSWQDFVMLNIILISVFVHASPAEDIFGGLDSGIYVNTGINLVKEGSVVFEDPVIKDLPKEIRPEIDKYFKFDGYGLYFRDSEDGSLIGQFLPGYPVWIAISYSLLGENGFLYVTPFIAILGILALYQLGAALFNRTAGLIASMLLAANILYIWFSLQPLSEIMANTLLLGGLYYLTVYIKDNIDIYAIITGTIFGTLFLVRIDSIILFIPLAVLLLYFRYEEKQRPGKYFIFMIAVGIVGISLLTLVIYYSGYFHLLSLYFLDIDLSTRGGEIAAEFLRINHYSKLIALLSVIAVYSFLMIKPRLIKKILNKLSPAFGYLKAAVTGLLASLMIYQVFIRPSLPFRFMSPQANSVKRLGWYFLPLKVLGEGNAPLYSSDMRFLSDGLIVLFLLCVVYLFYKADTFAKFWAFLTFLCYSIVYFSNLYTVPNHFWLNRRYIVIILPFLFLAFGFFISNFVKKHAVFKIIGFAVTILIAVNFIIGSSILAKHAELKGSINQVHTIANMLDDDALYIFDSNDSLQYHLLSLPLKYFYGKNVALLKPSMKFDEQMVDFLSEMRGYFARIYYCTAYGQSPGFLNGYYFSQQSWNELLVRRYEMTGNNDHRPPNKILDMRISFLTYLIDKKSELLRAGKTIDIGSGNEKILADGFYNAENINNITSRWTMGEFSVFLPSPVNYNSIIIRMSNSRPLQVKLPDVTFYIDDKKIKAVTVLQETADYKIEIPEEYRESGKNLILKGRSDTWMPKAYGVNPDVRELGVVIYTITFSRN